MEQRIKDKIRLYGEIYIECLALSIKANPNNSRYMANEMFREVAKDMRSELISRLQNGLQNECMEIKEDKTNGSTLDALDYKEENANPATENQRYALHKFGIEIVPESLTKKEASEILNNLVCLSKEGDREAVKDTVERLNAMDEWRIEKGREA
jgi:hypothetical protein